ncbi:hypothetical protein BD408DRAFT_340220 [Parasitella parasitica]|nr:hypothetical protein BD408DRAFT_340220 [Parasitella parasitica]
MAAVSFLETTNLVGLGLSADRVFSHVTDLNATKAPKQPQQPNAGLKIVADVVDSSYKVFDGLGKFWQRNTQELENKTVSGIVDQAKSVDELKIGEITELLADYKRLAAIIKQANLA